MMRRRVCTALAALVFQSSIGNAADTELNFAAGSSALAAPTKTLSPGFRAHKPSYGTGGWRCPPGLFWRKAGKQDWLCVDSAEAQRIAHENEQAALSRTERPDGTATCHAGLVRREAFRGDLVCVKPLRQHEVRVMNAVLYTVR